MIKDEKVFIRRLESDFSRKSCYIVYDSFNDIWYTRGLYGFGNIRQKIHCPYSIDFMLDYFGDDILRLPSYITFKSGVVCGLKNGNKFIRFFKDPNLVYNDKFINKILKDNFG